ncbi:MAG: glycosyltransferase [Pseudomonadota bacterium]|nr:glycosyltransferase [Pseudomonadota bacterium]
MKILIIHQNFPAQFKNLAPELCSQGHEVTALIPIQPPTKSWRGVRLVAYSIKRSNTPGIHPLALDLESKVIRGEACFNAALEMKRQGYTPSIILAHPGWGESIFLKDLWPQADLKLYCEFYYHGSAYDYNFDPEFASSSPLDAGRVHLKNANFLLHADRAHSGLTPTNWQHSTFPQRIREKLSVIHDGIDSDTLQPLRSKMLKIGNATYHKNDEVITFVSRNLEPYRGFHIFMRSLPYILRNRPNARVLIIGSSGVSYGKSPTGHETWKSKMIDEVFPLLDASEKDRIQFAGTLSYSDFISALQISMVHVYLTYPFILGWSLLEAMSCGCAIVGSKTPPVEEVISHRRTGLLVDFFDAKELAGAILELLDDKLLRAQLSKKARSYVVNKFDLRTICLPRQMHWTLTRDS